MSTRLEHRDEVEIVERIGDDLRAAFARAEATERRRRGSRRLRRVALATAALFTVVPTAVATRYIWAPDPGEHAPGRPFANGKPIQIGDVRGEVATMRISAFVGSDGLCWQIEVFNPTTSSGRGTKCQSSLPPGTELGVERAVNSGETFFHGWISPRVARVEVEVGGFPRPPVTIVRAPDDAIERAGLPRDLQFYVAVIPGEVDVAVPVRTTAYEASGRVIDSGPQDPASPSR